MQPIDLAVKVVIPLVGGKVEDLIAGFVGKAFDAENKVGVKWLAGRVAHLIAESAECRIEAGLQAPRVGYVRRHAPDGEHRASLRQAPTSATQPMCG